MDQLKTARFPRAGFAVLTLSILVIFPSLVLFPLYAQVAGGTITGTVSDASGASLPNARILVKDLATGVVHALSSDTAGLYAAPNLLPGTYQVTVSASGFSTEVRSGITVTVGAEQTLNFAMRVGQVSQTIEVTGVAPSVQLTDSSITAVVDSSTVTELPLNGRDWTQLATLQPGVVSTAGQQTSFSAFNRGFRGLGDALTISGARPQQNNYRVDGISVNDYTNSGPSDAQGLALGVDAIQEFSVLTANYNAEYGRTSGGVINAITRSGTDHFHGDAYEFARNGVLDASNFFDHFDDVAKPPFERNQFGGSVGGPIQKDRTFVFGDYEGLRQTLGVTTTSVVPSADARNGTIHNANGTTTTITVDPAVVPYLPLWHLPNGPLLAPGNTGIYSFDATNVVSENFAAARVDHVISDKDSLFGSWQLDRSPASTPDNLNDVTNLLDTSRDFVAVEETHTFNAELSNSFRFGFNRVVAVHNNNIATNPLAGSLTLGILPGLTAPEIDVPGLATFSAGVNGQSLSLDHWNSFQAYDDASWTKGRHVLKFGFAFERDQLNQLNASHLSGQYKFGSLTNFLTNQPKSLLIVIPGTIPDRGWRQIVLAGYFEDDFRLRRNLTVNLGVRYEMSTVPTEIHGTASTLLSPYASTVHVGSPIFSNSTLRNFEPRVGFAWDPFGSGKTSVRGGFGMFDVLPLIYETTYADQSSAPFFLQGSATNLAQGSFPTGAFSDVQTASRLRTTFIQQNPPRNYVMTWNLDVQRELSSNLTAMVAYVGSRGVHNAFRADDMNIVLPTLTSAGYLWPFPAGSGTVLNPNIGRMDTLQWQGGSTYHGLQAQITKRMSHGLQLQGSYTWSKAIDEGSSSVASDEFLNSIPSLYFFSPKVRRGLADFNIGQNVVISYTWTIPSVPSLHGALAWVSSGWELGGIFEASSGIPFTPLIGGDPLGENNTDPWAFPDRLTGPGCNSPINVGNVNDYIKINCFGLPLATPPIAAQCTPFQPGGAPNPVLPGTCSNLMGNARRNSIPGPGLANLDFSLFKNNYVKRISEGFDVQFRAEFFNVLNRANFLPPIDNSTLFDQTGAPVPGAGLIDSTSTSAREIQFAIKLIW